MGLHKTKLYIYNVFLKYFQTHTQVNANPLRWHDTLIFMKVNLIHKPGCGKVMPDMRK